MVDTINQINNKYNELVEELFEEVLCDNCRKTIKIGNIDGKLTKILDNETLFLCKECNTKLINQIKKF